VPDKYKQKGLPPGLSSYPIGSTPVINLLSITVVSTEVSNADRPTYPQSSAEVERSAHHSFDQHGGGINDSFRVNRALMGCR
jgi:hypothetical protein